MAKYNLALDTEFEHHQCEGEHLQALMNSAVDYSLHCIEFHANHKSPFALSQEMLMGLLVPMQMDPPSQVVELSIGMALTRIFLERGMSRDVPPSYRLMVKNKEAN